MINIYFNNFRASSYAEISPVEKSSGKSSRKFRNCNTNLQLKQDKTQVLQAS